MHRFGIATAIAFLGLFMSACGGGTSPPIIVDPHEDAEARVDLPVIDEIPPASDVGGTETGAFDAPGLDGPRADDVPADGPPGPCTSNAYCAGSPDAPACDLATGRCVPCTAASDLCPMGFYCDAPMTRCLIGCRNDSDCREGADGGIGRHCNVERHACQDCLVDAHCAAGNLCVGGTCVAGCNAGHPCAAGSSCCAGACVDTQTNVASCGGCNVPCEARPNSVPACVEGRCAIGRCLPNFTDCDGDPSNGCETNIRDDGRNCGGCGTTCPGVSPFCFNGVCQTACDPPRYRCGGPCAEETLFTCGPTCLRCPNLDGPGARTACIAGECTVSCLAGYHRCGSVCDREGVFSCGPGCERCVSAPWSTASCDGTRCVNTCNAGRADCNGDASDGCETDATTTANCGVCGRACSGAAGPHTVAACVGTGAAATCGAACEVGWRDCDGDFSNGCETTNSSCFVDRLLVNDDMEFPPNRWVGTSNFGRNTSTACRNILNCFGCDHCLVTGALTGSCNNQGTATLMDELDFSRVVSGTLTFYSMGAAGSSDATAVQVSTDGGSAWSTLPTAGPCACLANSAPPVNVDLSAVAGQPRVQFRFLWLDRCDDRNAWRWTVDDVTIRIRQRTY